MALIFQFPIDKPKKFPYIYAIMSQVNLLQQTLFQQIKDKVPENLSFVHEISELLEISYDSAYRRIRGEKELSVEELYRLGKRFDLSLDAFFGLESNHVVFKKYALTQGEFYIKDWLKRIQEDLKRINAAPLKEIIYAAKDPPLFHYFHFPEIAAFKFFFWEKTVLDFPDYEGRKYCIDDIDAEVVEIGNNILRSAIKIPTTEIWNEDTFRIFMRQIEYYWVSGYFKTKDDVLNLMDKMEKWVRHIQKQAELGFKYYYGQYPEGIGNSFVMYENEVLINDNSILVKIGDMMATYLTFNVISLLISNDNVFCNNIYNHMKQLMKKSNLISVSGEKERNRFFNKMLYLIDKTRLDLGLA